MSIWVCPHCPKAKAEKEIEKIDGLARLYAYPAIPKFKNNSLTILDSGAFGLSQSGGKMTSEYLRRLSDHYRAFSRENVLCVAPDVALNPMDSMQNFKKWHKKGYFEKIVPVLHSPSKYSFDEATLMFQAEFYRRFTDVIFWGSPKASADFALGLHYDRIFEKLKAMGFKWIHKLGVGWNLQEIEFWKNMPFLDSFDSISYYNCKSISAFGSFDPVENVKKIMEVMS